MVGTTRKWKNTFGKDKNTIKKSKKHSMEDKLVVNMHGVKVKEVVIGGKVNGQSGGPPTI